MIKSLRTKLALSFGAIFVVLIVATFMNLFYVGQLSKIQAKVINERFETVNAGKDIHNGINYSLAALRGYMILGADPKKAEALKSQRKDAWDNIDNNIKKFEELSVSWTAPKNIETLNQLISALSEFKKAQLKVENIAQDEANIASYQMLLKEAAPRASKILDAITGIINIEEQQKASSDRKAMLVQLANSRGSFAVGLANIRAFLLSGNAQFKQGFLNKWQVNDKAFAIINSNHLKLLTDDQKKLWDKYSEFRAEFSKIPSKMFELRSANDWNKANYILGTQAAPQAAIAKKLLNQMRESQNNLLMFDTKKLTEHSSQLNIVLLLGAASSFLISILIALWFSRDLLGRLKPLLQKTIEVSENNLSTPELVIAGKDEIAILTGAVNKMNHALISTISTTADSMQGVSIEANSIFIANTDMSKDIDKQNNQINMIAAAIEELSSSSKDVSNSSDQAAKSASESLDTAQQGGVLVKNSLSQMDEISQAFDQSAKSIASLSDQSKQVEDILGVIRSIAEQTNLLALNAAIEAARAGEQGRGFAVVADEVRELASRTTTATTDVEQAIELMRNDAQVAEQSMDVGRSKVKQGKDISDKVEHILQQIIASATDVSEKVQAIANTSAEQSLVTEEIAGNTSQASNLSLSVNEGINKVVDMTKAVSDSSSVKASELQKMIS
jgi:methyl-accepting chemotaxis protein